MSRFLEKSSLKTSISIFKIQNCRFLQIVPDEKKIKEKIKLFKMRLQANQWIIQYFQNSQR